MHSSALLVLVATFCLVLVSNFGLNRAASVASIGGDLSSSEAAVAAPAPDAALPEPERSAYAADLLAADRVAAADAAAGPHENESARKSRQILFTYPFGLFKGYPSYYGGYYPYAYPRYSYPYSYPYYGYSYPRVLYG